MTEQLEQLARGVELPRAVARRRDVLEIAPNALEQLTRHLGLADPSAADRRVRRRRRDDVRRQRSEQRARLGAERLHPARRRCRRVDRRRRHLLDRLVLLVQRPQLSERADDVLAALCREQRSRRRRQTDQIRRFRRFRQRRPSPFAELGDGRALGTRQAVDELEADVKGARREQVID